MKINEIHLNPENPRTIKDEKYQKLKTNIKEFPKMMKLRPIVIDDKNMILGGNMRYRVLQDLGYTEIPEGWVVKASELTEEEKRRFIITDNLPYGEWDYELLGNDWELEELQDWGMELQEIDFEKNTEEDDFDTDKAVEEIKEPICKLGDIWQLGEHRLMCGDSTKEEDVKRLMDGEEKYSILTDPPYNIDFNYRSIDDKKTDEDYKLFCKKWFYVLQPQSMIMTPGPRNERNYPIPKDKGIWLKKNATAGATCFHLRIAEPILFYGNFKKKRNTDIFDYSTGFTNELKEMRAKSGITDNYAPVKSIKLWAELIDMFGEKIIVDLFLGNGTTLIACEQLNRICYGMEIDPIYCDVIINRWEKYTGEKAIKL